MIGEGRGNHLQKIPPGLPSKHPACSSPGRRAAARPRWRRRWRPPGPAGPPGFTPGRCGKRGVRVGFDLVTLDGQAALLSHVDFSGPYQVGKYGVNLGNLHRLALPALEVKPGIDLIVVDEVGKMECLSRQFVEAMERLWEQRAPLLITVAEKGGGFMPAIKAKAEATLIRVTPANRDGLSARLREILHSASYSASQR